MNLYKLKEHLQKGGKVRKHSWKRGVFIKTKDNCFVKDDDSPYFDTDIIDNDWEVYREPKKRCKITHTGLYKTRDCSRVFVSSVDKRDEFFPVKGIIEGNGRNGCWNKKGDYFLDGRLCGEDIVAEWKED